MPFIEKQYTFVEQSFNMKTDELILKKTFNLLLMKGFDAVSITDIQTETGVSRGLLYHYFKNKEDLFIQVTEKYFVKIFDFDIRKTKNYTVYEFVNFMSKRFKRIAASIISIASEFDGMSKVSMLNYHFLFYQVMQRDVVFRNKYRATIEKELVGWEYALTNSIKANELKDSTDISLAAKQLFTLTDGVWFQSIFSADGKSIIQNLESSLLHYIKLLE